MGLQAAYDKAMGDVGFGGAGAVRLLDGPRRWRWWPAATARRQRRDQPDAAGPDDLRRRTPASTAGAKSAPAGARAGRPRRRLAADFDSLIDLITSTIRPTSWDDVGGPGSIAPFETNLSIVVSQTQEVHEEIVDLLEQLRRLQDLQVTIEVRFITLNDNFFERIGVNFDFDIKDNIDGKTSVRRHRPCRPPAPRYQRFHHRPGLSAQRHQRRITNRTVTVGLSTPNVFTADLDIPFTQGSYALAVPQFGGFDATAGRTLGFAILSDIEAYFFINAAQGDKRSNVLQAPKVTLFNGQQAIVQDTSHSPFVISVIPVVGDFAAAQQPVIVVLSEGTFMTVQAVVSNDRRFVRLTVVPFFSKISAVNTFTVHRLRRPRRTTRTRSGL